MGSKWLPQRSKGTLLEKTVGLHARAWLIAIQSQRVAYGVIRKCSLFAKHTLHSSASFSGFAVVRVTAQAAHVTA